MRPQAFRTAPIASAKSDCCVVDVVARRHRRSRPRRLPRRAPLLRMRPMSSIPPTALMLPLSFARPRHPRRQSRPRRSTTDELVNAEIQRRRAPQLHLRLLRACRARSRPESAHASYPARTPAAGAVIPRPPETAPSTSPPPNVNATRGRLVIVARDGGEGPSFPLADVMDIGREEGQVIVAEDAFLSRASCAPPLAERQTVARRSRIGERNLSATCTWGSGYRRWCRRRWKYRRRIWVARRLVGSWIKT